MTAREYFGQLREACIRMEEVRRELWRLDDLASALDESAPDGGGRPSGGHADPTARVGALIDRRSALSTELGGLEGQVGEGLAVIEGVRAGIGRRCADVLDARCIDGMSWEDAAHEAGCPKSTAMRRYAVACDWVDAVGLARAREGMGFAQQ